MTVISDDPMLRELLNDISSMTCTQARELAGRYSATARCTFRARSNCAAALTPEERRAIRAAILLLADPDGPFTAATPGCFAAFDTAYAVAARDRVPAGDYRAAVSPWLEITDAHIFQQIERH